MTSLSSHAKHVIENNLPDQVEKLRRRIAALEMRKSPGVDVDEGGVLSSGGLDNRFVVFDSATGLATSYDVFDDANSVMTAGCEMWLPAGTITDDCALVAGCEYVGRGPKNTVITGKVTLADGAVLANLSVTRAANDTSTLIAVQGQASGTATIIHCFIGATQNGAGTGYGIMESTGTIVMYGGSLAGSTSPAAKGSTSYSPGAEISTGSVDGTNDAGAEISGLTIGQWYCVEASGGPWTSGGAPYGNGGQNWCFWLAPSLGAWSPLGQIGKGYKTSGDQTDAEYHLDLPSWAAFVEAIDATYGRVYFQATATSIFFRVADNGSFTDNGGTLGWRLRNATNSALTSATIQTSGVRMDPVVGEPLLGDRSAFDALAYAARHTNDTDASTSAIHHTLGTGANQAAPGDHTHGDTDLTWEPICWDDEVLIFNHDVVMVGV